MYELFSEFKTYDEGEDLLILADIKENKLARISPIYNAKIELVEKAKEYYKNI